MQQPCCAGTTTVALRLRAGVRAMRGPKIKVPLATAQVGLSAVNHQLHRDGSSRSDQAQEYHAGPMHRWLPGRPPASMGDRMSEPESVECKPSPWHIAVAAEAFAAAQFARCGFDVSVQYGADQPSTT
jgi:hypothetical protein